METKICTKCDIEKNITEFRKNGKYIRSTCKECERKYSLKYYYKNKKDIEDKNRKKAKEYYYKNRERKLKYQREYRLKHKGETNEQSKKSRQNNKEYYTLYYKNYSRKRRKEKLYKFKDRIRANIKISFIKKGKAKSKKTEEILGISLQEFYQYLLKTFYKNYGYEWDGIEEVHIDHIIPLHTAKTEEEIINLCYYKNLQLLKAKDNLSKSDKLNWKLENNDD